jgi:DNA-binding MarR family transcriptional regulator
MNLTAPSEYPTIELSQAMPVTPLARDSLAILVTSLAARLNRGATAFYQSNFGIGMAEFRILLALGRNQTLNIGEVAIAAEVDKAMTSRSLRTLELRGLVQLQQTSTRGRAAIAKLTSQGHQLEQEIHIAARRREQKLTATLSQNEIETANVLLYKLVNCVAHMNKNEGT